MSEIDKRTPLDPNITLEEIIKNEGYYDINRNWNSIKTFDRYPGKIFRARVEVLIFNEKNEIYMVTYKGGNYRIPGGGIEKDRSLKYQVEKESEEEARIMLGKIQYTGISYFKVFKDEKFKNCKVHWDGIYNKVYVADFKDWYCGSIKESVRDYDMYNSGRFVPFERAVNILNRFHKKALGLV